MFHIGWNILSFPVLFFYLHNLREGWTKWYRTWENNVTRFGGWLVMRRWSAAFKKDKFSSKLGEAKKLLAISRPRLSERRPIDSFPSSARR
jgi:hypothetical protein